MLGDKEYRDYTVSSNDDEPELIIVRDSQPVELEELEKKLRDSIRAYVNRLPNDEARALIEQFIADNKLDSVDLLESSDAQ